MSSTARFGSGAERTSRLRASCRTPTGSLYAGTRSNPARRIAWSSAPAASVTTPGHAISRQVDFFTGRRERVEWKTYSYDEPADLTDLLSLAGFVADDPEALLLGEVRGLIHDVELPPGVRVRAVTSQADLHRVEALMKTIWGPGSGEGS